MIALQSSPYLPEFKDVQKTVKIPFRERWIDPLLHPVTLPFEPWISKKTIIVRERTYYYMGNKIICHPNNLQFIKDCVQRGVILT